MIIFRPLPPHRYRTRLHRFRAALYFGIMRQPGYRATKKPAVSRHAGFLLRSYRLFHTLTSGPREAGPFDPPLGPLGFGLRGTVRLRVPGSFSGFGVTGPSTNSKPIFSSAGSAAASSLTSTTRT